MLQLSKEQKGHARRPRSSPGPKYGVRKRRQSGNRKQQQQQQRQRQRQNLILLFKDERVLSQKRNSTSSWIIE